MPTQEHALQQVSVLKKELSEMRANQALTADKVLRELTPLDREVNKQRGLVSPQQAENELERSAHRETIDALESSEESVSENCFCLLYLMMDWPPIYFGIDKCKL